MFVAISSLAVVGLASAADWDPLVKIPGIPSTGINLSTYLVGLYQFMLSVVGIVAVMMLIVAGMRYITAAGNSASLTDAKDIAKSAIAGLLLALLSFVILKTINPDVLYLKQPGSTFNPITVTDLAACGTYEVATTTCTCRSSEVVVAADAVACASACETPPSRCIPAEKVSCLNPDKVPMKKNDPNKVCYCADGVDVTPTDVAFSCEDVCAPNNCLVADLRAGITDVDITSKSLTVKVGQKVYFDLATYSTHFLPIARFEAEFDWDWLSAVSLDVGCNTLFQVAGLCTFVPTGWCDGVYTNATKLTKLNVVFDTVGIYKSDLKIRDSNCNTSTDTVTITVENL